MASNDNTSAWVGIAGAIATIVAALIAPVVALFKRVGDLERKADVHTVEIGAMQEDLKDLKEAMKEAMDDGFERVIAAIKSK